MRRRPKEVTAQPRMAPRTPEISTLERARHLRGVDKLFSQSSVLSSVLIGRLSDIVPLWRRSVDVAYTTAHCQSVLDSCWPEPPPPIPARPNPGNIPDKVGRVSCPGGRDIGNERHRRIPVSYRLFFPSALLVNGARLIPVAEIDIMFCPYFEDDFWAVQLNFVRF